VNALRGAFPTLPTFAAARATREQLLLFHTPKHVNKVHTHTHIYNYIIYLYIDNYRIYLKKV
jgi:hypothetical protein